MTVAYANSGYDVTLTASPMFVSPYSFNYMKAEY